MKRLVSKDKLMQGLQRLTQYYDTVARDESTKGLEGYQVLDTEREQVLAVLNYCVAEKHWMAAHSLVEAVDSYLDMQGHWTERITTLELGIEAAKQTGNDENVIFFANQLAELALNTGDMSAAKKAYSHVLEILEKSKQRTKAAALFFKLGNISESLGDFTEAYTCYNQCLVIRKEVLGGQLGIAETLQALGNLAYKTGDYDESQTYCEQSFVIQNKLNNRPGMAQTLRLLGTLSYLKKKYIEARRCYDKCAVIYQELGNIIDFAQVLYQLGNVCFLMGDYLEASHYFNKSLHIGKGYVDVLAVANALHQLGLLAEDKADYEKSRSYYLQSITVRKSLGDDIGIDLVLFHLEKLCEKQGKTIEAVGYRSQRRKK